MTDPLLLLQTQGGPSPDFYGPVLSEIAELTFVYRESLLREPELQVAAMERFGEAHAVFSADEMRDVGVRVGESANGVLTFSESNIGIAAEIADACRLPCHPVASVRRTQDKYRQYLALQAAGVPVPKSMILRGADDIPGAVEAVGLPAVLKPLYGFGSLLVQPVNTESELLHALDQARALYESADLVDGAPASFMLQRKLHGINLHDDRFFGDYVSVESLVAGGDITHLAVTDKLPLQPPFRECGDVMPSSLPREETERIGRVVSDALRALGLSHGLAHTEVKLTAEGPTIIEVNPRLGGGVADLLPAAAGYDVVLAAGLLALGRPAPAPPRFRRYATLIFPTTPDRDVRVDRIDGLDDLRRLPGVQEVRRFTEDGSIPNWRLGEGWLVQVQAAADSLEQIKALQQAVNDLLTVQWTSVETRDVQPRREQG